MTDSLYNLPAPISLATLDSIKSNTPIRLIPTEMSLQDLIHSYSIADALVIFYCGALTILTIFILLLYVKTKENIYFHYVLYLFFMLIYGILHIESDSWLQGNFLGFKSVDRFIEPVSFLANSFYIFFTIELMEIKRQNIRLYKVLNIYGYSLALYPVFYFILYPYILPVESEVYLYSRLIIYPLSTLFMSWVILKINSPVKYYFIIGSFFYFTGAVIATVRYTVDNIPIKGFYDLTAPVYCEVGIIIEVLCFALALGHRIYYLHRDKHLANDQLIEQLSINEQMVTNMNIQLETEVKERTQEILEAQENLRKQEKKRLQTEYKVDMIKTEMLAHRMQVNSHLQFNCLNAIKYLIQIGENEKAANYLVLFSRFLRTIQETSERKMIPLSEEFEIVENFIKLEKNRFSDNFTYKITGRDSDLFDKIQIPPLLLQPFVDNAIWHGLLQSSQDSKRLTIRISPINGSSLKITIDDNGIGRQKANEITRRKQHKSMGIFITEERIKLYNHTYNNIIKYEIIDKMNDLQESLGTRVEIKLRTSVPFINQKYENSID